VAPAAQLKSTLERLQGVWEEYLPAVAKAKTEDQQALARKRFYAKALDCGQRILELVEKYPDDPASLESLLAITYGPPTLGGCTAETASIYDRALEIITKRYIVSDKLVPLCTVAHVYSSHASRAEEFLISALEKSPHRNVRGSACCSLGRLYQGYARCARLLADPITSRRLRNNLGEGVIKQLIACDPQGLDQKAEVFFNRLIAEYGDLKPWAGLPSLGDQARSQLSEIRTVRLGGPAPEIEGKDAEGKSMRLADYRGKVVMLVFWATWCGPCMAQVPYERELVKRLERRPFVLLGINGDQDRDAFDKALVRERINWRSWYDDAGRNNPIVMAWGVDSWPTVYLLDHRGVIRYRNLTHVELEQAIEKLVSEVQLPPTTPEKPSR